MDLHPTPFPGKRRPGANPMAKKEKDQPKLTTFIAQSKPKRTFGKNLSSNIMMQRPLQNSLTVKPWKPSGVSTNIQKTLKKVSPVLSCAGGARSGSNKKAHHVTFLEAEPPAAAAGESSDVIHVDPTVCTPVLLTNPLMHDTPFHSAENCSKCRLDKLETSTYWISQIKLAEPTGRHFVSAAFFRLALECEAQPFAILQNELRHYRDRHGVAFTDDLWDDLCRDYGLTSEDSVDAVLVEQFESKCTANEGDRAHNLDMFVDFATVNNSEEILDNFEDKNDESKGIINAKHSEEEKLKLILSMGSPMRNFQYVESPNSISGLSGGWKKSLKISMEESKYGKITSNDPASIKSSGNKKSWKKESWANFGANDLLKRKNMAEEQSTVENANLAE